MPLISRISFRFITWGQLILVMLLSHVYYSGLAQLPSRFLIYGVNDGLSQNSVHAIFRDQEGLVWIGTQDGLNSFDGKNFTVYRHSETDSTSISDQFVLKIDQSADGTIWVGTRNGLNAFNKRTQKFRRYYLKEEEKHQFQSSYNEFKMLNDGSVLIQKDALFILHVKTGRSEKLSISGDSTSYFPGSGFKCWSLDKYGKLFFTSDLRNNKPQFLTHLNTGDLMRSEGNLNGQIWKDSLLFLYNADNISTGILVFDLTKKKFISKIPFTERFTDFNLVSPNEIWLSGAHGISLVGMSIVPEIISTEGIQNHGLPPGTILTTYRDKKGSLWVGTSGAGVALNNPAFNNFISIKIPGEKDIVSALKVVGNSIIVGTRSHLYKMSFGKNYSNQKFTTVFSNKNISALTADLSGNIWVACHGEAVYVIDTSGKIKATVVAGEQDRSYTVLNMFTDNTGRIFISTILGMYVFTDYNKPPVFFTTGSATRPLLGNYVMHVLQDSRKNFWVSNNLGLDVIDSNLNHLRSFPSNDDNGDIKRTIITSTTEDVNADIWIGTIRNGIFKLSNGKFTHFNSRSGLSSDVVYNVTADSKGRIWATTSSGLNIFHPASKTFVALTAAEGVPNAAYFFNAMEWRGNDLMLGTSEGILICKTDVVDVQEPIINAFISDIKINGNSIGDFTNSFEVIPDNKMLSFELAANPAYYPGRVIFQYRLKGQQETWSDLPAGVHTLNYNNLPYKNLQLEIRAGTSLANLESAKIFNLEIISKAPVWKRAWFVLLMIFVFAGLITWLILYVNKRRYDRKLAVLKMEQSLQNERIRIGRDLHDNIGAYTSALIAGLNNIQPASPDQAEHILDLKDYGSNIMGFLRETIWMLNAEKLTITAFSDRFKNYAMRINKNYPDIDLMFHDQIDREKELSPTLMLNIFRILQEALQNALKHSGAKQVIIETYSTDTLKFIVRDNGHGFIPGEKQGHYGIQNMQSRSAESGFLFTVQSNDLGTIVTLEENTANAALENNARVNKLHT